MVSVTRHPRRSQPDPALAAETAGIGGVLLVATLAIGSMVGIVVLSEQVASQVAPAAIAAISAVSLAAIGAVGVVLRRRPRRSTSR